MFYVGSHLGSLNDGYVGSNKKLKDTYHHRPDDFKRRILYFHPVNDWKSLLEREQYWLNFIRDDELTKKYYNFKKYAMGGGIKGIIRGEEYCKKISASLKGRPKSEEHKQKIREVRLGTKTSEEAKIKMRISHSGSNNHFYGKTHTEETRLKIRSKRMSAEGKETLKKLHIGMKASEKTKKKMSKAAEHRQTLQCPHCGIIQTIQNINRWHFDNCHQPTKIPMGSDQVENICCSNFSISI